MGDTELGARLKKAREEKGLKQSEACEALGIPKVQTLSAYERGVNAPPIETIKKIAILYNVTTDWLFFGVEKMQKAAKTPFDYLLQIIEGADFFRLSLHDEGKVSKFKRNSISIELSSFSFPDIEKVAVWWHDLRKLYDNGTLDKSDYETLLNKRLSNVEHMKELEF